MESRRRFSWGKLKMTIKNKQIKPTFFKGLNVKELRKLSSANGMTRKYDLNEETLDLSKEDLVSNLIAQHKKVRLLILFARKWHDFGLI